LQPTANPNRNPHPQAATATNWQPPTATNRLPPGDADKESWKLHDASELMSSYTGPK